MKIDTTLPGSSGEIVSTKVSQQAGTAGVVAIVGRFEKGDGNKPYYFTNARQGQSLMGDSEAYPGSKLIELIFETDPDNNNYGATKAITVKAGASIGASITLVDTTATPVNMIKLTAQGGLWGNNLTATVASGTGTGKKLVIKNTAGKVLDSWDNCETAIDLYNKILAGSNLNLKVEALDLTKTLKDVAEQPFSGGTEVANPTTTDIDTALKLLIGETPDIIIFTDVPTDSYYAAIKEYIMNTCITKDKMIRTVLPIDPAKTVTQRRTLELGLEFPLAVWIAQEYSIGSDQLSVVESAARYAAAWAGLPVGESLTNQVINGITGVSTDYGEGDRYLLVDAGETVMTLANRENSTYKVVSAITGSHEVDETGKKTALSEQHAIATFAYVWKYLDVSDKVGSTGFTKTKEAVDGEIENRRQKLIPDICSDVVVETSFDPDNNRVLIEDLSVKAFGILKWIVKRGSLLMESGITGGE